MEEKFHFVNVLDQIIGHDFCDYKYCQVTMYQSVSEVQSWLWLGAVKKNCCCFQLYRIQHHVVVYECSFLFCLFPFCVFETQFVDKA